VFQSGDGGQIFGDSSGNGGGEDIAGGVRMLPTMLNVRALSELIIDMVPVAGLPEVGNLWRA
jgi:hypothetical protein